MNGHDDGIDTDLDRLCIIADSGSFLQPEQPQEEPLISIPGVGEIVGTLGENYPAFYWFMVEHVSANGGSNDYQR